MTEQQPDLACKFLCSLLSSVFFLGLATWPYFGSFFFLTTPDMWRSIGLTEPHILGLELRIGNHALQLLLD